MYVLVNRASGSYQMLEEVRSAGEADALGNWTRVSVHEAHNWVRTGGTHNTALYVDDRGRVNRAWDGE